MYPQRAFWAGLTVLARQLATISRHVCVNALALLLSELWNVIPVPLQGVRNITRCLGITQLQNRIVVHCPILCLLVLSPDLLPLDTEDLDTDATRGGDIVRNQLRSERGVAHDTVINGRLCKHALSKMRREVVVNDEFADHTLY